MAKALVGARPPRDEELPEVRGINDAVPIDISRDAEGPGLLPREKDDRKIRAVNSMVTTADVAEAVACIRNHVAIDVRRSRENVVAVGNSILVAINDCGKREFDHGTMNVGAGLRRRQRLRPETRGAT